MEPVTRLEDQPSDEITSSATGQETTVGGENEQDDTSQNQTNSESQTSTTALTDEQKDLESSGLEEEDRELIEKNWSKSSSGSSILGMKFRHLQPRHRENDKEEMNAPLPRVKQEGIDSGEEEDEAMLLRRKRVAPEDLEKLFEEDEEDEEEVKEDQPQTREKVKREQIMEIDKDRMPLSKGRPSYDITRDREMYETSEEDEDDEDDMADFIEDVDEDEGDRRDDGSIRGVKGLTTKATQAKGNRQSMVTMANKYLTGIFGSHLSMRVVKDLLEIFGDGTEYQDLIDDNSENEDESELDVDSQQKTSSKYSSQLSQVNVSQLIKETDLPESIITRDGPNWQPPELEELAEEAIWITSRWRYGHDPLSNERIYSSLNSSTTSQDDIINLIEQILKLIRIDRLEVPVIATHRKEYFQPWLGLNDLWAIWDADGQWRHYYRKKFHLKAQLNRTETSMLTDDVNDAQVQENYLINLALNNALTMEELDIIGDYINKQTRTPINTEPVIQLVHRLCKPLDQLIERIKNGLASSTVIDKELVREASAIPRSTLVNALASFLGHHPLLTLPLRQLAQELATISVTPTVRGRLEVLTPAVRSGPGQPHELSPWKYIRSKPLKVWEVDELGKGDPEPLLSIFRGQVQGLLNYSLEFDAQHRLANVLVEAIGGPRNQMANQLISILEVAAEKTLQQYIFPRLRQHILTRLRSKAEWWSARLAQFTLQDKLMVAPYDPHRCGHPTTGSGFRIGVITWSGPDDRLAVIVDEQGRLIDYSWLLQSSLDPKVDNNNSGSKRTLMALVEEHRPSCLLIAPGYYSWDPNVIRRGGGSHQIDARELFSQVERQLTKLSAKERPLVFWGEDDVARSHLRSVSPFQRDQGYECLLVNNLNEMGLSALCRYALSVGRRWICPLIEISAATLADASLLALASHTEPSSGGGSGVSKEIRLKFLRRAFINVVNLVGVDLGAALSNRWHRAPLCYVCGLGPTRAILLIKQIEKDREEENDEYDDETVNEQRIQIKTREELHKYLPGPIVFFNCISFFRIRPSLQEEEDDDDEEEDHLSYDPLDNTRIHPENYHLARKMAADALEIGVEEQTLVGGLGDGFSEGTVPQVETANKDDDRSSEDQNQPVQQWGRRVVKRVMGEEKSKLDDLLLEEYARELVRRGYPPKQLTLLDIKSELQRPYGELRTVKLNPSPLLIFDLVMGGVEHGMRASDLWTGRGIKVRIVKVMDRYARGRLIFPDRNLEGQFEAMTIIVYYHHSSSDGKNRKIPPPNVGQVCWAQIRQVRWERWEIEANQMSGESSWAHPRHSIDPYYDWDAESAELLSALPTAATTSIGVKTKLATTMTGWVPAPRKVMGHPAWRSISRTEAESLLCDATLGEVILRPCTGEEIKQMGRTTGHGKEFSWLTWKIDDDEGRVALYQQLLITGVSGNANEGAANIGEDRLAVGNTIYEDVDEIIVREVEMRADFLREVKGHSKFLPLPVIHPDEALTLIERHLQAQRDAHPQHIAYCLCLARDRPGQVWLSYTPDGGKPRHERVDVNGQGVILRGERFGKIEAMISWFKLNWNKKRNDPPPPPTTTTTTRTTNSSSSSNERRGDSRHHGNHHHQPYGRSEYKSTGTTSSSRSTHSSANDGAPTTSDRHRHHSYSHPRR